MTEFVVCFATSDGKVARMHAYGRGEGSLRDENHVRDIVGCFSRGNEGSILCEPPGPDERVMFEITLGVSGSRRGGSVYSGWEYRQISPCPQCVAEAGMDVYRQIKRNLRRAARDTGQRMKIGTPRR